MNLDPRTLLFALILTNALMGVSLFVATSRDKVHRNRDGMSLLASAMLLETFTWLLIAARGAIPDLVSIVIANGIKAGAHALILAAIYEFQRRPMPRWQYLLPVTLILLMGFEFQDDMRARFVWGSLLYGAQMGLIAHALLTDAETRIGRAWRLLFGGVIIIIIVLAMRAIVAQFGLGELARVQGTVAPHWVQIVTFIALMATSLLGSVGFVLMIKERTDREIMQLAMTDSLTLIPNRRALMEQAAQALARRHHSPLALLMIDVDHFKRINDTCGHLAGDEVLHKIANMLTSRLRRPDIIGRYGGEEFCVIAPDTTPEGAYTLADSLRETISANAINTSHGDIPASISIGIALCPSGSGRELKEMLEEADAALYSAKQDGRNRTAFFNQQHNLLTPLDAQIQLANANPE